MKEPTRTDHPNPLKRVGFDHTPCPVCGCRYSLERIRNEIELTKRLTRMKQARQRRAQAQARQAGRIGTPVVGKSTIMPGGPVHTLNFGSGLSVIDGGGGGGGGGGDGVVLDPGGGGVLMNEVALTSRTCAECGVRYEPDFENDRENLLDQLAEARMEASNAIDLLGDLARDDG